MTNSSAVEPTNYDVLSWLEIDDALCTLAQQLRADAVPDLIVAIQRGGLIPAVRLSHILGVRRLLVLDIARTASDAPNALKTEPVVRASADIAGVEHRDVLLVDDVVGSGLTLRVAQDLVTTFLPLRVRTLACVLNLTAWNLANTTSPGITYVGRIVSGWVVFPWEQAPKTDALRDHASDANQVPDAALDREVESQ